MIRLPFVVAISCFFGVTQAQDVLVYGRIMCYEEKVPLAEASVRIISDGQQLLNVMCDSAGYYEVTIDVGHLVRLDFQCAGRVTKSAMFDLRLAPNDDGGYGMNVDIRLFVLNEAVDVAFLREPIGIAAYDSTANGIVWDMEYTGPRMERLKGLYPALYELEDIDPPYEPDSTGTDE